MFAGLYTLMTITVPPAVRSRSPTIGIWRGLPLRDRNVCARRVDAVLADASAVRVDLEVQVAPAGALLAADLTDWLPIVTAWLRPIHAVAARRLRSSTPPPLTREVTPVTEGGPRGSVPSRRP